MPSGTDIEARLCRALARLGAASSDFDLNPQAPRLQGRALKPAAVLIGVSQGGDVVLTRRSAQLKHHAGQIAFPGGRQDPGDADAAATALREAHEEIGLPPKSVRVLGHLPAHETVTAYCVTPVVAMIDAFTPIPEPSEVAEVFWVPADYLLDLHNYAIQRRRWRGDWRCYNTVPWGPYYIWGATARMLRALAEAAA